MQRIKGQDCSLSFTDPGGDVEEFGFSRSFDFELNIELIEEEYLGHTSKKYDEIYNGVGGNTEMHIFSAKAIEFAEKVRDRATRRESAGGKFSVTGSFSFPSGQRMRLTFEDVFFGAIPIGAPSRKEYVKMNLTWKCEQFRRVG